MYVKMQLINVIYTSDKVITCMTSPEAINAYDKTMLNDPYLRK